MDFLDNKLSFKSKFEILATMSMKTGVCFWMCVFPCSLVAMYRLLGVTHCFHSSDKLKLHRGSACVYNPGRETMQMY